MLTRRHFLAGCALPAFSKLRGQVPCASTANPSPYDWSAIHVETFERPNADNLDVPLGASLAYDPNATPASLLAKGYELLSPVPGTSIKLAHFASLHACMCDENRLWDVHSSGAFALWHRALLYFHERAINRLLINNQLLKIDCLRIPFWHWDDPSLDLVRLPVAYTKPILAFPSRTYGQNFSSSDLFGVADTTSYANFNCFSFWLQRYHKLVHDNFLGSVMGDVPQSPIDPIFYAHHSNIDRMFETWRKQPHSGHIFGCGQEAFFWNVNGGGSPVPVSVKLSEFTSIDNLGYTYPASNGVSPPLPNVISLRFASPWSSGAFRWIFFADLSPAPPEGVDVRTLLKSDPGKDRGLGEIAISSDEKRNRLNPPAYTLDFLWGASRPNFVLAVSVNADWRVLGTTRITDFNFFPNAPSARNGGDDCAVTLEQCTM